MKFEGILEAAMRIIYMMTFFWANTLNSSVDGHQLFGLRIINIPEYLNLNTGPITVRILIARGGHQIIVMLSGHCPSSRLTKYYFLVLCHI